MTRVPGTLTSRDPVLETPRLILRVPRREDFEGWARVFADPVTMVHVGGVQPRFFAWRHFLATVGSWQVQGFGVFSVIRRADGAWIGRVGPLHPEGWPGDEIGWTLAREAWGQGYATEAATAATDWAFEELGWSEIIHCIAPGNHASQAVAKRLGSAKRGPGKLPAPYEADPVEIWGQSREEWFARRRAAAGSSSR